MQSSVGKTAGLRFFDGGPVLAFLCILASASAFTALAADDLPARQAIDEERLARRIKAEILRELREDKWVAEQVELGIARYVERMNAVQAAAAAERAREADLKAKAVRRPTPARDHIRGAVDAEISLIEYSDFECPYCKTFHQSAAELLKIFAGEINWVYRHFPLALHNPGANKQAEASECARQLGGQAAFWAYADALFARTASGGQGFPTGDLVPLAKKLGLNPRAFEQCLASGRHAARVKEDFDEGQRIGVWGTPGIVVLNNKTGEARIVVGILPVPELKARITQLMKNGEGVQQSKDFRSTGNARK